MARHRCGIPAFCRLMSVLALLLVTLAWQTRADLSSESEWLDEFNANDADFTLDESDPNLYAGLMHFREAPAAPASRAGLLAEKYSKELKNSIAAVRKQLADLRSMSSAIKSDIEREAQLEFEGWLAKHNAELTEQKNKARAKAAAAPAVAPAPAPAPAANANATAAKNATTVPTVKFREVLASEVESPAGDLAARYSVALKKDVESVHKQIIDLRSMSDSIKKDMEREAQLVFEEWLAKHNADLTEQSNKARAKGALAQQSRFREVDAGEDGIDTSATSDTYAAADNDALNPYWAKDHTADLKQSVDMRKQLSYFAKMASVVQNELLKEAHASFDQWVQDRTTEMVKANQQEAQAVDSFRFAEVTPTKERRFGETLEAAEESGAAKTRDSESGEDVGVKALKSALDESSMDQQLAQEVKQAQQSQAQQQQQTQTQQQQQTQTQQQQQTQTQQQQQTQTQQQQQTQTQQQATNATKTAEQDLDRSLGIPDTKVAPLPSTETDQTKGTATSANDVAERKQDVDQYVKNAQEQVDNLKASQSKANQDAQLQAVVDQYRDRVFSHIRGLQDAQGRLENASQASQTATDRVDAANKDAVAADQALSELQIRIEDFNVQLSQYNVALLRARTRRALAAAAAVPSDLSERDAKLLRSAVQDVQVAYQNMLKSYQYVVVLAISLRSKLSSTKTNLPALEKPSADDMQELKDLLEGINAQSIDAFAKHAEAADRSKELERLLKEHDAFLTKYKQIIKKAQDWVVAARVLLDATRAPVDTKQQLQQQLQQQQQQQQDAQDAKATKTAPQMQQTQSDESSQQQQQQQQQQTQSQTVVVVQQTTSKGSKGGETKTVQLVQSDSGEGTKTKGAPVDNSLKLSPSQMQQAQEAARAARRAQNDDSAGENGDDDGGSVKTKVPLGQSASDGPGGAPVQQQQQSVVLPNWGGSSSASSDSGSTSVSPKPLVIPTIVSSHTTTSSCCCCQNTQHTTDDAKAQCCSANQPFSADHVDHGCCNVHVPALTSNRPTSLDQAMANAPVKTYSSQSPEHEVRAVYTNK